MADRPELVVEVFVGVDIAKGKHYACAVSAGGEALFARRVPNDEAAIRRMINDAAEHGRAALVVDTTSSGGCADTHRRCGGGDTGGLCHWLGDAPGRRPLRGCGQDRPQGRSGVVRLRSPERGSSDLDEGHR